MRRSKRLFDLFWSALGLLLLFPVFLGIALAIKFDDGGPVFFRQRRIGYRGRPFAMWKFRTMVVDAEQKGGLLTVGRDPRVTRVGYWLRKTKLDELPQLWNVLKGEMSLVGPRPEVPQYVALYTEEQRRVLELVPGITDPASIRFRHENELLAQSPDPERTYVEVVMPEKIRLNLEYARRATVWSDFAVILQTFLALLRPSNAGEIGQSGSSAGPPDDRRSNLG
ncbi:MAG: glycosyltransferase [Brockia lithotrophica]|uniref:Glycosyltransferase n=1 Tax=Brockia lithotrophica TaxID=933949 RepID=A0A2T5G4T6_9BACL|nr:sugar transferase [Brockia lithotrophica]PTQ51202.1 MAG: glycosyltransferase [Brockia lithotrophica]